MLYRLLIRYATGLLALLFSGQALAAVQIQEARLWTAPDNTRLVLDLNRPVEYRVFRLHDPERVVLDLEKAELKTEIASLPTGDPVISMIRYGKPESGILRIVIEVKEAVQPRSFLLKPMHGKPHRLVLDLDRSQQEQKPLVSSDRSDRREVVIVVDAGHGGEDPGAIGRRGLKEKDVTLAVAKELAAAISARPGMRAVLTRNSDYFVTLKKRVKIATEANADLMISIHADSVRNRKVRGASVYTLAEKGATPDKVAAALAAKENASDAIGGAIPDEEEVDDPMVHMILGDLQKRESMNSSQILAEQILKDIRKVGPVKYSDPKRARFAVLSNPLMPSVLVELDYISNPKQERQLRNRQHQKLLAQSLLAASLSHLKAQGRLKNPGSASASSKSVSHVVRDGESLWSIAKKYGVSISALRSVNHLKSSRLRIGQKLIVPSS